MHELHTGGLVKYALRRGGSLSPVIVPEQVLGNQTGTMNPSLFVHEGRILMNLRHINYILYHSEGRKFPHQWGPLVYVHPQNDVTLTTYNVMCEFDANLNLISAGRVNTKDFDTKPTWNFIGLEDARLFSWDNKLFLCGVRRDCYDDKGKGRMEMAEIEFHNNEWKEVSRNPIPAPGDDSSYCEKNWMPIVDKPWHFVKWSNPTQVVHYDIEKRVTTDVTVKTPEERYPLQKDLRGGSQVVRINENMQMAFVHETNLLRDPFGRKDGNYAHRIVIWDNDWNITNISSEFHFLGTYYDHVTGQDHNIEFCTGLDLVGDEFLISFGLSDNVSYILKTPANVIFDFISRG